MTKTFGMSNHLLITWKTFTPHTKYAKIFNAKLFKEMQKAAYILMALWRLFHIRKFFVRNHSNNFPPLSISNSAPFVCFSNKGTPCFTLCWVHCVWNNNLFRLLWSSWKEVIWREWRSELQFAPFWFQALIQGLEFSQSKDR